MCSSPGGLNTLQTPYPSECEAKNGVNTCTNKQFHKILSTVFIYRYSSMETVTLIEAHLQDCQGIEPALRSKAEARFVKELQRQFPSEQALVEAWEAWSSAAEGADEISPGQEQLARSWLKAFERARFAGFRDIAVEEAFFEVKLH